jgi:hypothetical protein
MLYAATWLLICSPIFSNLRKTKGNEEKSGMCFFATAIHVGGGCHCFGRKFCRKFRSKTSCLLKPFLSILIINIICHYQFSIFTSNCKPFIITCSYVYYDSVSEFCMSKFVKAFQPANLQQKFSHSLCLSN